jgi:hypothetical protein
MMDFEQRYIAIAALLTSRRGRQERWIAFRTACMTYSWRPMHASSASLEPKQSRGWRNIEEKEFVWLVRGLLNVGVPPEKGVMSRTD